MNAHILWYRWTICNYFHIWFISPFLVLKHLCVSCWHKWPFVPKYFRYLLRTRTFVLHSAMITFRKFNICLLDEFIFKTLLRILPKIFFITVPPSFQCKILHCIYFAFLKNLLYSGIVLQCFRLCFCLSWVLENPGSRLTLNLDLYNGFVTVKFRLTILGRNSTWVMFPSQCIISRSIWYQFFS